MSENTTTSPTDALLAQLAARGVTGEPEQYDVNIDLPVIAGVIPKGHELTVRDLSEFDHLRAAPRRVKGHVTVTDTPSWLAYFGKHRTDGTEVYGDVKQSRVTAVLNAPAGPDQPAWADHRLALQLEHSPAWRAWTARNGQWLSQTDFAEHLEDRTPDLVEPDAATMLELAQTFRATTGVKFESSSKLHNGERRLSYIEEVSGSAGQRGQIAIPTQIKLQLQVWRGVAIAVPLTARFRYRVAREGLALGFVLDRLDDVLDAAWSNLLSELGDGLGDLPILAGPAPAYS